MPSGVQRKNHKRSGRQGMGLALGCRQIGICEKAAATRKRRQGEHVQH